MTVRIGETIISGSEVASSVRDTNHVATPIYNWTGTLNEYNALGTYNPDWLYYITDDYVAGGTAGGRNIGDIFYSMRTDISLSGAVRCNGNTYYIEDFTGTESIGNLLSSGKLPYISLEDYAAEIADHGNCGKFGWDGGNSNAFRVPTLNDVFLEASNSNNGSFVSAGLPNITGSVINDTNRGLLNTNNSEIVSGAFKIGTDKSNKVSNSSSTGYALEFDASQSNSIYGNSTTVQPNSIKYSAFIQLTTGTTDIALETCSTMSAQVAANVTSINILNEHRVIAYQEPTAENGYTWYRKYADGWCEQGGQPTTTSTIVLLVPMATNKYWCDVHIIANTGNAITYSTRGYSLTTTGFSYNNASASVNGICWEVYGKYAQE